MRRCIFFPCTYLKVLIDSRSIARVLVFKYVRCTPLCAHLSPFQFTSLTNASYPELYARFLRGLDLFNFDLVRVICFVDGVTFHYRLLAVTLAPLVLLSFLAVRTPSPLAQNVAAENRWCLVGAGTCPSCSGLRSSCSPRYLRPCSRRLRAMGWTTATYISGSITVWIANLRYTYSSSGKPGVWVSCTYSEFQVPSRCFCIAIAKTLFR